MKFPNFSNISVLLIISAVLLVTACGNPVGSEEEKHHHAVGAVLKMNGAEIVRIEEGEVVSGNLEVSSEEETPLITIYFLNEEGEQFHPEESGFRLKWDQIDTTIAEIEHHAEDGKWSFHLVGVSPGETTVRFQMWHDGEEHSDFKTPGIPITVN